MNFGPYLKEPTVIFRVTSCVTPVCCYAKLYIPSTIKTQINHLLLLLLGSTVKQFYWIPPSKIRYFCGWYFHQKGYEMVVFVHCSNKNLIIIKFIYSEKATKFCEIFPLLLTECTAVKVRGRFCKILWPSQNIWTLW